MNNKIRLSHWETDRGQILSPEEFDYLVNMNCVDESKWTGIYVPC